LTAEGGTAHATGHCSRAARCSRGARRPLVAIAFTGVVALVGIAFVAAAASADGAGSGPVPAQAEDDRVGVIGGRAFVDEGETQRPLRGVRFTVSRGGEAVARATTDAEGRWTAEVPHGRGYSVTIDVDSLPDDVELRDEEKTTLTDLNVGNLRRIVVFPLGPGTTEPPFLDRLTDKVGSGLKVGAVIGMAAVGLSLIFGVTGLINFAHGEYVTFGALMAYFVTSRGGIASWPLILGGVFAVAAGGLFGWASDAAIFAPLRRRRTGNIALIVFTIGLSLFLRYSYQLVFGPGSRAYRQYAVQRSVFWGLAPKDLAIIAIALAAMVAVGLVLQRTRLGTAIRAVADNRDLSESSGIDVNRIIRAVWVMGAALAALGGVLLGVTLKVDWDMGYGQLLLMFAAVVLGGLGSAYGAMVGGLVVGLAAEISTLWVDTNLRIAAALLVLIIVLLFRPQGILGVRERLG
jgi:branched-chain amino acid transport system permease protein